MSQHTNLRGQYAYPDLEMDQQVGGVSFPGPRLSHFPKPGLSAVRPLFFQPDHGASQHDIGREGPGLPKGPSPVL